MGRIVAEADRHMRSVAPVRMPRLYLDLRVRDPWLDGRQLFNMKFSAQMACGRVAACGPVAATLFKRSEGMDPPVSSASKASGRSDGEAFSVFHGTDGVCST